MLTTDSQSCNHFTNLTKLVVLRVVKSLRFSLRCVFLECSIKQVAPPTETPKCQRHEEKTKISSHCSYDELHDSEIWCLFVNVHIYSSIYLCVYSLIHLFTHLSIYLFNIIGILGSSTGLYIISGHHPLFGQLRRWVFLHWSASPNVRYPLHHSVVMDNHDWMDRSSHLNS